MAELFTEDIIEELIERLAKGEGLATICRDDRMPNRRSVTRWMRGDDDLAQRIMEAREVGFHAYAEETLELVAACEDPHRARVLLDARRWYLGKISQAFADKPIVIGALVNVDASDAFAAVTGALEIAASRIASCSSSTRAVVIEGEAGPSDPAGGLADLAGDGGPRLGQDAGRS